MPPQIPDMAGNSLITGRPDEALPRELFMASMIESFVQSQSPHLTAEQQQEAYNNIMQELGAASIVSKRVADLRDDSKKEVRTLVQDRMAQLVERQVRNVANSSHGSVVDDSEYTDDRLLTMSAGASLVEESQDDQRFLAPPVAGLLTPPGPALSSTSEISHAFPGIVMQDYRYEGDLTQKTFIGKGGFGSVWKCRQNTDLQDYAVKQIALNEAVRKLTTGNSSQEFEAARNEILKEARTLARLDHHNVVRYYTSWIGKVLRTKFLEQNRGESSSDDEETSNAESGTQLSADDLRKGFDDDGSQPQNKQARKRDSPLDASNFEAITSQDISQEMSVSKDDSVFGEQTTEEISTSDEHFFPKAVPTKPRSGLPYHQYKPTKESEELSSEDDSESEDESESSEEASEEVSVEDATASEATIEVSRLALSRINSFINDNDPNTMKQLNKAFKAKVVVFGPSDSFDPFERSNEMSESPSPVQSLALEVARKTKVNKVDEMMYVLYIQMSLYPISLTDYIYKTTEGICHNFNPQVSLKLMQKIMDGVEYLHDSQLAHRDLKPDNVFLSYQRAGKRPGGGINVGGCHCMAELGNNDVCQQTTGSHACLPDTLWIVPKIGDFGLVRELLPKNEANSATSATPKKSTKSHLVGTATYRPPVDEGPVPYEKSDVYALGIILLELIYKMATGSERVFVLHDLNDKVKRSSNTWSCFPEDCPTHQVPDFYRQCLFQCIFSMTDPVSSKRFTLAQAQEQVNSLLSLYREQKKSRISRTQPGAPLPTSPPSRP